MSEGKKENLPQVVAATKKRPKRFSLDLTSALHRNKFNPITQLISVFPELKPEDRAKTLLAMLPYLYPKIDEPISKKPRIGKQTNIQLNGSSTSISQDQLDALRSLAASDSQDE